MRPEWALAVRDRCEAAGVAFFFKQWGRLGRGWRPPRPAGQRAGAGGAVPGMRIPNLPARCFEQVIGRAHGQRDGLGIGHAEKQRIQGKSRVGSVNDYSGSR
jgi:hypothetical protein